MFPNTIRPGTLVCYINNRKMAFGIIALCLSLIATAAFCDVEKGHGSTVTRDKKNTFRHTTDLKRRKRATLAEIGVKATNRLLKDTKFIFTDGLNSIFTKTGGYNQAVKDFESVHPIKVNVKKPKRGNEKMSGHIGNTRIVLERDLKRQVTKLTLERQPSQYRTEAGYDLLGERIIIYSDEGNIN